MGVLGVASPRHAALAEGGLWARIRKHRWHYAFLVPMLALFLVFELWPIVATVFYSFYNWDGFGPLTDFVGWDNYVEAIGDPAFGQSFRNTFAFTAAALLIQLPLALGLAMVLNNRALGGRNVYRMLFFLPVVSTTAVVGVVFLILLSPVDGPVNAALTEPGVVDEPINFLGSESLALPTVIAVDLWKVFGVTLVYWLAALQTVPRELLEAAKVDGASRWASFRHVTVPTLIPLGVVIVLLTTIQSFNAFDIVQTMTAGGPGGASEIVQTYIYRTAFDPAQFAPRYGFASAIALMFGVVVALAAALQYLISRRVRDSR
ncbi:carbohydrate ABC transporter permease [Nonomuraea diastatica]|nr:sugar ABC transporter permease [Nonomuraea diastatica]